MPANTTVNGNAYSFVQIETFFGVLPTAGIKDISYKDNLRRADGYGTASVQLYLTRGTYKAEGSIELYKRAFNTVLLGQFGPGFRQVQTFITVSYGPDDLGIVITDTLPMVFFGEISADNPQTDDGTPLTNKVQLIIPTQIVWNGLPSVLETFPLIAVA